MKRFLKNIISIGLAVTLFGMSISLAPSSMAAEVASGSSGFIEYDPSDVPILEDTIDTGTQYSYKQEYFYQQIDDVNKQAYDTFKEELVAPTETGFYVSTTLGENSVSVSSRSNALWTEDEITDVQSMAISYFTTGLTALMLDHPADYFWLDVKSVKFSYNYTVRRSVSGYKAYVTSIYFVPSIAANYTSGDSSSSVVNAKSHVEEFNTLVDNFTAEGETDAEKLKSIYYYVATMASYKSTDDYNTATAGSVLLEPHYTVCEGYANAIKVLCDKTGIACVTVAGNYNATKNTGHAWNEVRIDGKWYGIDITWDDLDNDEIIKYKYFLLGNTDFSATHTPGSIYKYIEFTYPVLADSNYYTEEETTTAETTTMATTQETTTTTQPTTTTTTKTTTTTTTTTIATTPEITTTTESVVVIGDINEDGVLSIADAVVLQKYLFGKYDLKDAKIADINNDGLINVIDLSLLMSMVE